MVTLDQGGRSRSKQVLRAAAPGLGAFVEHYWIERPGRPGPGTASWRIVPDHAPHVIWQLSREGAAARLVLVGARTIYTDLDVTARARTVGARLRPGSIPALFGLDASDLTDRAVSLEDLIGPRARRTCDGMADAGSDGAFDLLAGLLAELAARGNPIDSRARVVAGTHGGTDLDTLARSLGVGARMLRVVAQRHLGMGAGRLRRIHRLHQALHSGVSERAPRWARIAAVAGYADQAHLIRDCRALLGETPGAFLARASP